MNTLIRIVYEVNGEIFKASSLETEHFSIKTQNDNNSFSAYINAFVPLKIKDFSIKTPYKYSASDKIFVNGYQSWTDSLEYSIDEKMSEQSKLTEFMLMKSPLKLIGMNKSGDNLFHQFPRQQGVFYGWSYGYVRNGDSVDLFASLDERCGYTVVTFDVNGGCVTISKELEGVTFEGEKKLAEFVKLSGGYDEVFDRYFALLGVECRESKRRNGYTTWYNYYGGVTQKDVVRDLNSISEIDAEIDCFQIDDGYQTKVGDWLSTDKKKFPDGMKSIADSIHSKGMTAGLWLAPFAAVPSSQVFKEHKDWFIKDENGKPYKTGHNWGGFYSLDIYNEGAREYIKHVFDVVLNDWGYDLVKLDFLYGACVLPMHNKTRGEIMCDAMDLLRECVGDKLILGCGVPLMPAFGKVDYCRIGSDIALDWRHKKHMMREDVSTPHAVCNAIFRRHLDGRAWLNDPDVFLLRDTNIKTTLEQRKLLAKLNSIFGNLLFTSDDVAQYNGEQLTALLEAFDKKQYTVSRAEFVDKNIMEIDYSENGAQAHLKFNTATGERLD
ncbi:MAG: alpha-galactosidase [Eubacteriales bacterium]|nr:alpha-galactosidase [Eubacteriales bacterium]